jgi:hypothetical protein
MIIESVDKYLKSPVEEPYFLFVSDESYKSIKENLSISGFDSVPTSDFCNSDDKLPDLDELLTYIKSEGESNKGKRIVVTGLGELLALRGSDEARNVLLRLKDFKCGGAKVVLLLRGLASEIASLRDDQRFDNRRFSVIDKAECGLSITLVPPSIGLSGVSGFKAMLIKLENGHNGNIVVKTALDLDNATLRIRKIKSAYDGIKFSVGGFSLDRSYGSDSNWEMLLIELSQDENNSLDMVFEKYGFSKNLDSEFYKRVSGGDYLNWLFFIYLKSKAETLQNGYLRFVLDKTDRFEDFVSNILNEIIEIPHTDKRFSSFYQERKTLVEKFPESDIASFVANNRHKISESIYKLTDNTRVEREEIVAWLSQNGVIPELEEIYPTLAAYLKKYIFKCPELADLLTDYFEAYKRQKLSNKLESSHLEQVNELAVSRQFNQLTSRSEIIDGMDKSGTYLYWLDALGVEYLSLIETLAQQRGLSIRVHIARAELPTITSINRSFYDDWQGGKQKNPELDEVKHKDKGGYSFANNDLPIHLARELDIIVETMDKAATELALRSCKRFLIVSDHGASRLAVIHRKEEKYQTDTPGLHSGRCCKLPQHCDVPYDLPFAAKENGYLVLADYGRFKGSRAANVEVHGGASLEEVVVPIIEIFLKDGSIRVKLVDDSVTVDYRNGAEVRLFCNSPVQNVSLIINEKSYPAVQASTNHYTVKLSDINRAGNYPADVYAGDDLIGKVMITAHGRSGKIDNDFDDLF